VKNSELIFEKCGIHCVYTKKELSLLLRKSIPSIDRMINKLTCPEFLKKGNSNIDFPLDSIIDYMIKDRIKSNN